MGDNRWMEDAPGERAGGNEPVRRPPPASAGARLIEAARPWVARGVARAIAFARTLPGRASDLAERIDMPRRMEQSRHWIAAQDFPAKARRTQAGMAGLSRKLGSKSRQGASAATAKAAPILSAAGRKSLALARAIGQAAADRSAWLTRKLGERKAAISAAAAEKAAALRVREAEGEEEAPAPVPSELMRLLKEEGVAVDGMDVREALPKPVRSLPLSAQGSLPLFADDPPPFETPRVQVQEDIVPTPTPPPAPPPPPRTEAGAPTGNMAQSAPSSSQRAGLKSCGSALFTRRATDQGPLYKNRKFQMTIGATAFVATAAAVALMMQGGGTSSPGNAQAVGQMDRSQVEGIVRDYILAHPEIIPEAMERLQSKRTASIVAQHRSQLETPFAGGWEGARDGDVVLVEFFDYACGYCRASLPDIDRLLAEDKKLKVVYRELPILSEESNEAAKASLYAAKQGQYGAFHRALYAAGRPSKEGVDAAAKKAGVDPAALKAATNAPDISAEIENNIRLAQALQATGTPTWVVGDQVLSGAVGYEALKEAIARARLARQ